MADEKMFASITPLSMQRMIEASGIDNLPDDIAVALADDASYRLREVVCLSAQFMKICRRSCLRSSDVAKALELLNLPPVWGADESDKPQFHSLEDDTSTCVHYTNGDAVILADNGPELTIPSNSIEPKISSEWIRLDGEDSFQSKLDNERTISAPLQEYFSNIVNAIMGGDEVARNEALVDLRKNSKINPLIPYFVNFTMNVKAVSHDIDQLFVLLQSVHALVGNQSLALLGYLKPLASSILYCVLEPLTASINPINDHWRLRDYGSRVISLLFRNHSYKFPDFDKYISESILNILLDPTRPLCSHYGAIVTVNALGIDKITSILVPNIAKYYQMSLKTLVEENDNNDNNSLKEDAYKVIGLLLNSLQMLFNHVRKPVNISPIVFANLHNQMIEIFGDSLSLRLPTLSKSHGNSSHGKYTGFQLQPMFAKSPIHGNNFRSSQRSLLFPPLQLQKRNISISIKRYRSIPSERPVEYCHSPYFFLSLKLAFIGRSQSKLKKQYSNQHIDLCDVML